MMKRYVIVTSESVDAMLLCYHSNETCIPFPYYYVNLRILKNKFGIFFFQIFTSTTIKRDRVKHSTDKIWI